jgi:hypothetical protein
MLAGAAALAGLVWGAAPAAAASHDVTLDCTSDVILSGQPGDTYNLTVTGDCLTATTWMYVWNSDYLGQEGDWQPTFLSVPDNLASLPDSDTCSSNCGEADPSDWYFYVDGTEVTATGMTLQAVNYVGAALKPGDLVAMATTDETEFFRIIWAGPGGGAVSPLWHQAVGRQSADAGCAEGWSASWQAWAESVTGGWVCTRDVVMYGN